MMNDFNTLATSFVKTTSNKTHSNSFVNAMKQETNFGYTENGGVKHNTTNSALLDMFGMGGSMRKRDENDIILMFKKAYLENPTYALKCLWYLRDILEGAGERRFFRICLKWLASYDKKAVLRNIETIARDGFGRFDDLLCLFGTPCENAALEIFKNQLTADMIAMKNPSAAISLAGKWMPSINSSSSTTKQYGRKIASYLGVNQRTYRKMLSALRERIHIVERLMSQNRWDEIDFSKLPSRAGLIYHAALEKHQGDRYRAFMSSRDTKVNANVLNPVDIAHQIFSSYNPSTTDRQRWDKYWGALKDYYCGREEPGIAIVDVSGSMWGIPMEAAVSMGAYIAERGKGPFQNHFFTFSSNPQFVEFEGIDIYDKFQRARCADWGGSTNIEAVFNMMLDIARKNRVRPEDMPKTLYIFSDMEFDSCVSCGPVSYERWYNSNILHNHNSIDTVIESQMRKWKRYGYTTPRVIFWNLDAREKNISALGDKFSYVSGFSMSMVETILGGKDGYSLMMEKLDSERYKMIH